MSLRYNLMIFSLCICFLVTSQTVYFQEDFEDGEDWEERWVESDSKQSEGKKGFFECVNSAMSALERNEEYSCGAIKTSTSDRFYSLSSSLDEPFSNKDLDLILQYTVQFKTQVGCGGGAIKLLPEGFDQDHFSGDTPYLLSFGPDICGSEKKLQLELISSGDKAKLKGSYEVPDDNLLHFYRLELRSDNTYQVTIDFDVVAEGEITRDFQFEISEKIQDPKAKKPSDWDDRPKIQDPHDQKPDGYDDIQQEIPDPAASRPKDWDEGIDGIWQAPKINNPLYKGGWRARQIDNPKYRGQWQHPMISNPKFTDKSQFYNVDPIGGVAFEMYQLNAGAVFDNILLTDDSEEAKRTKRVVFEQVLETSKQEVHSDDL